MKHAIQVVKKDSMTVKIGQEEFPKHKCRQREIVERKHNSKKAWDNCKRFSTCVFVIQEGKETMEKEMGEVITAENF